MDCQIKVITVLVDMWRSVDCQLMAITVQVDSEEVWIAQVIVSVITGWPRYFDPLRKNVIMPLNIVVGA
jgi:hypothetical protein